MLWNLGLSLSLWLDLWEQNRWWRWQREWLVGHDVVFSFHRVACSVYWLWLERSCSELDWLSLDIFSSSLNRDSFLIQVELDVQMVEDLVVNCLVVTPDA